MLPGHWGQLLIVVGASAAVSGTLGAAIPIMFAPGFRMAASQQLNSRTLRVFVACCIDPEPKGFGVCCSVLVSDVIFRSKPNPNRDSISRRAQHCMGGSSRRVRRWRVAFLPFGQASCIAL